MAGFFARRKYRNEVMARVNAMLLFYPGGVQNVAKNYPGLPDAINGNFDAGDIRPGQSAVTFSVRPGPREPAIPSVAATNGPAG